MANKYLAMYYRAEGEYEKAKKYCVEALRLSSQEEVLLECMRGINRELIRIYEERLSAGTAENRDVLELGWCYLQNEEAEKGAVLLEERSMENAAEAAEYHNLLSKCRFVECRYLEAAEEAEKSILCLEREGQTEEGQEGNRIPGRIAGACEIIAKSFHVLAKDSRDEKEKAEYFEKALSAVNAVSYTHLTLPTT